MNSQTASHSEAGQSGSYERGSKPTSYPAHFPTQFPVERTAIVRNAFDMLKRDYGTSFSRQFSSGRQEFDWKCRLLELTAQCSDEDLLDGLDSACVANPGFPPTIRIIEAETKRLKSERQARERNDNTLRNSKETPNFDDVEKVKALLGGVGKDLKIGKNDGLDPGERAMASLRKCLEYETRLWEHTPDKTMPRTRAAALAATAATGLSPPQCAADAAEQIGGEILSKFTQICDWMSPDEICQI